MYGDFFNLIEEIDFSFKVNSMFNIERIMIILNFIVDYILEVVNISKLEKKK